MLLSIFVIFMSMDGDELFSGKAAGVLTGNAGDGQALQAAELFADSEELIVGKLRIQVLERTLRDFFRAVGICAGNDFEDEFADCFCTFCHVDYFLSSA